MEDPTRKESHKHRSGNLKVEVIKDSFVGVVGQDIMLWQHVSTTALRSLTTMPDLMDKKALAKEAKLKEAVKIFKLCE